MIRAALSWLVVLLPLVVAAEGVHWEDTFADDLSGWELLNDEHWSVEEVEGERVLRLTETGPQRPPVRRPGEYALVRNGPWRDVTLTVKARSLEPASQKNRDVVLIFGYRDETHFYYAHLSSASDGKFHNVIMKVEGATRRTIHHEGEPEPRLSDGWHNLQVRHLSDGAITVWVDDLQEPLMTARDTDYPEGRVGVGSFDDRAEFSRVAIDGRALEK